MIYRSEADLLCAQSGDQGDSAMRAGMAEIAGISHEPLHFYEAPYKSGLLRRSPVQQPWDNVKNFSRDQMIPLVAAMFKRGMYSTIQRFFYKRMKRLFFMQNTERDVPGSTKYPWPHKVKSLGDKEETTRLFDYADPLLPQHIWHIIKAGRIYWAYPFAIIGIPCYLLDLAVHSLSKSKYEENQHIAMAYVNGNWAMKLFKKWNTGWKEVSKKYWQDRNEIEYHNACVNMMENM